MRDVIADHDRIADHYKYRTPYGEAFFKALVTRVGIDDRSTILDLCCGTGAVAAGLSPYCRQVVAVDGASRMIAKAPKLSNVVYAVQDINSAAFADWIRDSRLFPGGQLSGQISERRHGCLLLDQFRASIRNDNEGEDRAGLIIHAYWPAVPVLL